MAWSVKDPRTGKRKYVTRVGSIVLPTSDKNKALSDIPEGWELNDKAYENGKVKFSRKR